MPVANAKWMRPTNEGDTPNLIRAEFDGEELFVPKDAGNRHYQELMAAVRNNELEIEAADPEPAVPAPTEGELTPRQFEWMLSYYELEAVWDGIKADAKAGGNKNLYSNLRAQEKAGGYILADTLELVQQVRDQPRFQNSTVDLSDDAIRRYWAHASVQKFGNLLTVDPEPT